ncbi:YbbR domain-containing protein [Alkalispirochaeta americana]|uniref:YbbR domain-containing protein n=1 Tax=Alkalispirochaeta americana TaxID=159291 RepID=A0A1N6VN53_9SPIO|nr:CdaR family protein [Alkalispirochaeta americana]SIQ79219.1 YbbR domain-containing protein [Alkalispirochaeta americana]
MKIKSWFQRLFQNWPVKVLCFAVALLLLVFHDITRLEERFLTVPLEVRLSANLVPASTYPQQLRLRLRGESEQVFRIVEDDLRAVIDLRDFSREGVYRVPVDLERRGAAAEPGTLEISVEPESLEITLEEKAIKSVEVVASTSGFVPTGYSLERTIMTPSAVEIQGPRSRIEGVEQIRTEDVDLSSRREDFTERIRLVSPDPLIAFRGGEIVELRGIVEERVVLETFDPVDIVVSGLDQRFSLDGELPSGSIRVQVRQIDLEGLAPGELELSVDASAVSAPGTIRLPLRPVVPPGFVVLRYEPTSLQLNVTAAP